MILYEKEEEHCGCNCHHEDHHKDCDCDDCDCDECRHSDDYITFEDEATGEKFKALMLFNCELGESTVYYAAFGDLENPEAEVTVIPLEADKDGKLTPIDINVDPRADDLKKIFDDWQDQMSQAAAAEDVLSTDEK